MVTRETLVADRDAFATNRGHFLPSVPKGSRRPPQYKDHHPRKTRVDGYAVNTERFYEDLPR